MGKAISAVLAASAAAFAVVLVHGEFYRKAAPARLAEASAFLPGWRQAIGIGHVTGNTTAPVRLIEFADLECPFCRGFNSTVQTVLKTFPNQVAYEFVEFPLPMHRFARPAARALECMSSHGSFGQAVDRMYEKQDSLGLKPWVSYALDAGVRDTTDFIRCADDTAKVAAIETGVALGKKLGVHATPTVVLNGWRYGSPPSDTELIRAIRDLLAGKSPYPGYSPPRR